MLFVVKLDLYVNLQNTHTTSTIRQHTLYGILNFWSTFYNTTALIMHILSQNVSWETTFQFLNKKKCAHDSFWLNASLITLESLGFDSLACTGDVKDDIP